MLRCYRLLRMPVSFWADMDIFTVCITLITKYFEKCPDVRLFRDAASKPCNMRNTVTVQHPCALQRYAPLNPPVTLVTSHRYGIY
jgi:hypothetical protein